MSQQEPQFQGTRVAQPEANDILCGKDKQCVAHVGSVRFRSIIESYRQRYANSLTKFDKMQITKEIYETLSQSSRFLKFNTQEKVWEEISPMAARDKCGHALRFANRNKTKGKNATGMRVAPETASLLLQRSSPSVVSACNSSAASSSAAQAPSPAPPRVASPPSNSTTTMPSTMPTLQMLQQQQQQAMPQLQLSQQQHQEAALAALKRYDSLWNAARIPVVTNPGGAAAAAMGHQAAPPSVVSIPSSTGGNNVTPESLLTTVLKQHHQEQQRQQQQQTAAHHRKRSTLEDLCSILAVVEPSARQILGGN